MNFKGLKRSKIAWEIWICKIYALILGNLMWINLKKLQNNLLLLTVFQFCSNLVESIIHIQKMKFCFFIGGSQLLDLIITELKSHMTCYNSMPLIGWNYSIQTGEQILQRIFLTNKISTNERPWIFNRSCDF